MHAYFPRVRQIMDNEQLDAILRRQLNRTLTGTDLPELGTKYTGKVRDNYTDSASRAIVVTDRLSTFDVVVGTIPFKGQVLNQLAAYWFHQSSHIAPNHLVSVPDPNCMIVHECRPIPVEFVMRAYLTGVTDTSIWRAYERGERVFCGHRLPDGMRKNQRLSRPLLTPSTKAPQGEHDISVSREQLLAMGAISAELFERAATLAKALFAFGQTSAAERGMILVDTKYEFGLTNTDELVVIDEIHTPDSSRYWYRDDDEPRMADGREPRSLDKEYVRRWLVEEAGFSGDGEPPALPDNVRLEAARRYIAIYERLTGTSFEPDTDEPQARIARNLGCTDAVDDRAAGESPR